MSRKKAAPSPREHFLADILASPEDDGPRLIYADWLTDHGQTDSDRARGEFIHLQCRMAALEENCPERSDMQPRERDLLADHGANWMTELPIWTRKFPCTYRILEDQWPNWVREEKLACTFRRGFVAAVAMSMEGFANSGHQLFKVTPLEGACLSGNFGLLLNSPLTDRLLDLDLPDLMWDTDTVRLVECPRLARLRRLRMNNSTGHPMKPETLAALASSAHLKALTRLELNRPQAGRSIFPAITALPNLQDLRLLANSFSVQDIRELALLSDLARLHTLSLSVNKFGDEGVAALAASPHAANLRELDLTNTGLTSAGVGHLARSQSLAGLRNLSLAGNQLGIEGAAALAKASFTGLTVLRLWNCNLTDEVLANLLRSSTLDQLRTLELTRNPLTASGLEVLASANLRHLHTLHLGRYAAEMPMSLAGAGLRALVSSPHLARLDTLALSSARLGDAGVRLLAKGFRLPNLRRLGLRHNGIGPAGAELLAASGILADLRFLDLFGNPLRDAGALALAASPHLEHIRQLNLDGTGIGKEGKAALKKRFGTRVTV